MEKQKLECDLCGACCKTFVVLASKKDSEIEPRILEESLEMPPWLQTETRAFTLNPLPFHEGCCFLGKENLCSIYETRPQVCREFEAGSPGCAEARARIGLKPLGEE